jgi:hypothetical protein
MSTEKLGILAMCALAALLFYFAMRRRKPKKASASALFQQLVVACRDADTAERLVERQRALDPNAPDVVLVRRALAELRADKRR